MLIRVFCIAEQASSRGVLEGGGGGGGEPTGLLNKGGGGGSNSLPGLVTKQQAVEFPQVLTSLSNSLGDYVSTQHLSNSLRDYVSTQHLSNSLGE